MLTTHIRNLFLFVFAVAAIAQGAHAADVSIGVVDVQKVLTESNVSKQIQKDIEAQRHKFRGEISAQEQKLRDAEKTLSEQSKTLSPEEFAKKRREFEESFQQTRTSAQKRKKELDDALVKAMMQLKAELTKVVEAISKEKGYTMVIAKQEVVLNDQSLDITDAALQKINDSNLSITLDIPAN